LNDPAQGLHGWEIFRDIDSLGAGEFLRDIQRFLVTCDVVLVVIGPRWKEILDERDPATDVARHEIRVALNSNALVIPVLAGNASIPEFPRDLLKLADLNMFTVRNDPDFDADMERLSRAVAASMPTSQPTAPPKKKRGIVFNCEIILSIAVVLFLGGLFGTQMLSEKGSADVSSDRNSTRTAQASTAVAMSNVTQTGAAPMPSPTPEATATMTPEPTEPLAFFVELDFSVEQFERGTFQQNAASIRFDQGCESGPEGITVSWDVSNAASYAGSMLEIPPETAAAVQNNWNLVFWAEGEDQAVQLEVGLREAGGQEHNERVSLSGGEISIPLDTFAQNGVDVNHLTHVVIRFDYSISEESRQGTICVGGFGFGTP
jgi:hypothetical protein